MNALDTLLTKHRCDRDKITARIIIGLLVTFIIWACFAQLEEVAVATGEVVPQEQIQSIQHLEGGIIEEIMVFEGDKVKKGQPLMQLNLTPFMANKEELQIQLEALQLKKVRLQAEAKGMKQFAFTDEFANYRENLKNAELQTFAGNQAKLANDTAQLAEQVAQRELDITQLETERNSIASNIELLREKYRISSDLVKDKLTSRLDHLQLKGDLQELEGRLQVINVAIPRAQAALKEARDKLAGAQLTFQNKALQELNEVEQAIARTQELLNRATDQVNRTTITSPIDGVVKALLTHTIGGVVKPGQTIMEIVPTSDNLIIEAKLDPKDIGFVKTGQTALVKVNTYDYARFGGLQGKVISISADSLLDKRHNTPYFLVKIRTDKNFLGDNKNHFPITAGMQVTVDIKTGQKSVISYLLKPVIKLQTEAFRER